MIETQVRFEIDGLETEPADLDDDYLAEMLMHTAAQIREQVQSRLGRLRCSEHQAAPRVVVTAAYTTDVEQMELAYHVDACCPALLLQTVQALNH